MRAHLRQSRHEERWMWAGGSAVRAFRRQGEGQDAGSFEAADVPTGETSIFLQRAGSGAPILLLHGFPETHLMWRGVAPLLARRFTVICADLRGYGRSGCPPSALDHAPYAKRGHG